MRTTVKAPTTALAPRPSVTCPLKSPLGTSGFMDLSSIAWCHAPEGWAPATSQDQAPAFQSHRHPCSCWESFCRIQKTVSMTPFSLFSQNPSPEPEDFIFNQILNESFGLGAKHKRGGLRSLPSVLLSSPAEGSAGPPHLCLGGSEQAPQSVHMCVCDVHPCTHPRTRAHSYTMCTPMRAHTCTLTHQL